MKLKDEHLKIHNGVLYTRGLLFNISEAYDIKDNRLEKLINKYHSYHLSTEEELWLIVGLKELNTHQIFYCVNLSNPRKGCGSIMEYDSINEVYNRIDMCKQVNIKHINNSLHDNDFSIYNFIKN